MTAAQILGEILIGWLVADLGSGLVHWWQDRAARADWPLIGRRVIAATRLHHREVLAFTRSPVIERNLATWLVVALLSAAWAATAGPGLIWLAATLGGLVVGEVHRHAHLPAQAPRVVRVLQDTGLIQSPAHHAGHHRTPSDRRYCILTNWLNPALDALGFWSGLEAGLARIGLTPNRGTV